MSASARVIAGSTIAALGGWLTLTSAMIEFQQRVGPSFVTMYLFCLTLAPALLARPLLSMLSGRPVGAIWCACVAAQAALAVGVFALRENNAWVLLLLALSAVFQNAAASSLMDLIGRKIPADRTNGVITAVSSGSSLAIVLGPAAGGIVLGLYSFESVLLVQFACLVCAMALVPWTGTVSRGSTSSTSRGATFLRPPHALAGAPRAKPLIGLWVNFVVYGVLIDSLEMPVLVDVQGLSPSQVGMYISLYGVGGVLVFAAATFFNKSTTDSRTVVVLVVGTFVWLFNPHSGLALLGFMLCGLGYSLVNSSVRNVYAEILASNEDIPVSDAWAWLFQVSLTISAGGFLLSSVFFHGSGSVGFLVNLLLAVSALLLLGGFLLRRSMSSAESD